MKTQSLHNQLVEWRHDLHMHPQISFEEEYAAAKVSTLLKAVSYTHLTLPTKA